MNKGKLFIGLLISVALAFGLVLSCDNGVAPDKTYNVKDYESVTDKFATDSYGKGGSEAPGSNGGGGGGGCCTESDWRFIFDLGRMPTAADVAGFPQCCQNAFMAVMVLMMGENEPSLSDIERAAGCCWAAVEDLFYEFW